MLTKKTIITISAVAVVAFMLGTLLSGNDVQSTAKTAELDHSSTAQIWTCSMHPQVQLPEPGKCPICFMDLIPLGNMGEELAPNQIKLSPSAIALAKIQTSEVVYQSAGKLVQLPGKVVVDQNKSVDITARFKGRIDKLYFNYPGEKVKAGQKLAMVYSPEIIALHDEILQSKKLIENNRNRQSLVVSSARQTIESAKEKMHLLGITAEQIEKLYNLDSLIEYIDILSEQSGTVMNVNVEEGTYLNSRQKLMTIASLDKLWVEFEAYETDLKWLKKNQTVKFSIISQPGEIFEGQIIFIDAKVDPAKRNTIVRVAVDNQSGFLKPDMLASGTVNISIDKTSEPQLLIPASAPLITGERAVVYLETKAEDGSAVYEGREIALGSKTGDYYIVQSGLEAGDRVVTNGAFKIDSELQIQAKPSMMAPDGAGGPAHNHNAMDMEKSPAQTKEPVTMSTIKEDTKKSVKAVMALTPVYHAYFETQMALANDDLENSLAGYKKVNEAVKDVDMTLFSEKGHLQWMDYYKKLLTFSESGSNAENFESARRSFNDLSKTMIEMHNYFGHADDVNYYLTYCPMAFDHTGAYWLQTEPIVWNSFYGEQMLRCGSIKDTLNAIEK